MNGSSDVEVSQTDERNEDGEVELEQVPEPDDVIRIQTQLADFQWKVGSIDLEKKHKNVESNQFYFFL
jgi:hypothetical protein